MPRWGVGMVMMWWICLGSALVAVPQPAAPTDAAVSEGQRLFVRHCSACHGMAGQGDGPAAPALQQPPADLTRIAQRRGGHFPVAEISAYIDGRNAVPAHGRREMPVWGVRFEEIVGSDSRGEAVVRSYLGLLVAYLQSIQQ